jgi:CheY-like chemotaxis protein
MILRANNEPITILLVEDDDVDVMNVKRAFKKNDIENPLIVAGNGLEALDKLRNPELLPKPKIILLDINMPKMNGIEFLKELRSDDQLKSISVFIMTTSNDDSDKFDAYNLNVAGYILKPLSFTDFVSSVKNLKAYWSIIEFS